MDIKQFIKQHKTGLILVGVMFALSLIATILLNGSPIFNVNG